MPKTNRIKGIFKPFGGVHSPIAYVTVLNGATESLRGIALLDTGADCTIMSMDAAIVMLGMSRAEIEKNKLPDSTVADEKKIKSYTVKRDIRLWHEKSGGDFIPIDNATICIFDSGLLRGFSVLIGQLDGFSEKVFRHQNRKANRVWELWT